MIPGLVRVVLAGSWLVVMCSSMASAQAASPPRFGIADNSFLVEEAFNQEAGIFQNIFVALRSKGGQWAAGFTQEWPVRTQRHQLSVTLAFTAGAGSQAIGDALVNYRLQVLAEAPGRPAFSPRLSVILPSSQASSSLGWQMNLPVSKRLGAVYLHGNAGMTWLREAQSEPAATDRKWTSAPFLAGSAIVAVRPMFHLMFESVVNFDPRDEGRETSTTIVPGFRTGWNIGDQQLVVGFGVPVTRGARRDHGILTYVSYELPFLRK